MNNLTNVYCNFKTGVKVRTSSLIKRKSKGDDKLIIALVLAAVGVGLCIIYRNQIFTLIGSFFTTITTKVNDLFNSSVTTG